ncbi:GNAT family N-acetyltransferase [Metabacillus iocasae]|uniref:GNAT superfamily N-acetyltransferase n=1 Tax=Priestia iocasae TaxID=2291674 RepID=A0ABS2QTR2_9BACI|nr:GNAT family N-acetyltransferase [Metabacillus iocasae]MBM7702861.1 GNAT superfamily N-acetyltransferase [Metabacillus iocasae]
MVTIHEISTKLELFDDALQAFWGKWGSEDNKTFYEDCMRHSCTAKDGLPRFYVALDHKKIVGTYAILRNDLNSRQDLFPWFACLYVDPTYRGQQLGAKLLQHALDEARYKGYPQLYLTTDLENYYEKYGWTHSTEAIGLSGHVLKVYEKSV